MRFVPAGYVSVIPSLYGSYLPHSNNGHRDATVPLTEARTEMIHGQLESYSSFIWFAYPNLSPPRWKVLLASRTYVIIRKVLQTKKTGRHSKYRKTKPYTFWQKGMDNPLPTRVKMLGLLRTPYYHPSLLSDHRKFHELLVGGDLYYSCCFGVHPDVCLTR